MISEATRKLLQKLSSGLAKIDLASPLEAWRDAANASDELAAGFRSGNEPEAEELTGLMGSIAGSLANGIIANPGAGVKVIQHIIGVLRGLESGKLSESARKQAMAEAHLFFRDIKEEESRVKEATTFEDDEEQREMIMAIESRIDELEADLLNLNPPESDSEVVRSIFRQFHTLKGEGAICGIKSVAEFCHGIETEIEDARSGGLTLTQEIVSVLQELAGIIRPILAGQSREEIGEDVISSLMGDLKRSVAESKERGAPERKDGDGENADGGADKFADFFSAFAPPPDVPGAETGGAAAPEIEETPEEAAAKAAALAELLGPPPPPAEAPEPDAPAAMTKQSALDADSFLAGLAEDMARQSTEQDADGTGEAPVAPPPAAFVEPPPAAPAEQPVSPVPPAVPPPPAAPAAAAVPEQGKKPSPADTIIESGDLLNDVHAVKKEKEKDEKEREAAEKRIEDAGKIKAVSIDVNRLDELMELVGEVSLVGSYLTAKLAGHDNLALQAVNLSRACTRLQEMTNSLRMTSVRPLFMTVRRAAADAARASRKMIDINMRGIDTQVDRAIVESLSAALIHIIRNAVDHGIEPADVRRRAGKPERGTVVISASRTNSDIVIELGDDGKGFDIQAIRDKAVKMGKISPDAKLTDEEVADLVFLPGLSTAKKVTGLSGRGVGMEIVRTSIDNLRGRVEIKTDFGKGSTIRMRFPLMVAAMEAMLVRVGENILAIPVSQVRECFRPTAADIGTIKGGGTIVTIRGVILPVLFLSREFGIAGKSERAEDGVLVVVETGEMLAAVLVDETIGSAQVVVRSMEGPLAKSNLVAGAAILPDGSIGMVIETSLLTERVSITAGKAFSEAGQRQADSSRQVDTVSIGSNQVGMIDFNIMAPGRGGPDRRHVFAINAFKTREFVHLGPLRSIPNSPSGFAGMMMLRSNTIPVVHMGVVLGLMTEAERRPEWERIVLVCEFAGKTVGFLVTSVERVSYISWSDIMPPPSTAGLIQIEFVVGTILMSKLKGTLKPDADGDGNASGRPRGVVGNEAQVAFVLDFERIVGNVIQLYGDMGAELGNMSAERKDGIRILLVEDSPLIRKRTNKALSAAGITVIEAGDGQEAWDKIEELRRDAEAKQESIFSRLDLILSDIEMPRMDGYTLTYNIKHDPALRVLPVLLHSSITNDSMISRATEVEADGFIPKCDPKELAEQLRKYL